MYAVAHKSMQISLPNPIPTHQLNDQCDKYHFVAGAWFLLIACLGMLLMPQNFALAEGRLRQNRRAVRHHFYSDLAKARRMPDKAYGWRYVCQILIANPFPLRTKNSATAESGFCVVPTTSWNPSGRSGVAFEPRSDWTIADGLNVGLPMRNPPQS